MKGVSEVITDSSLYVLYQKERPNQPNTAQLIQYKTVQDKTTETEPSFTAV